MRKADNKAFFRIAKDGKRAWSQRLDWKEGVVPGAKIGKRVWSQGLRLERGRGPRG